MILGMSWDCLISLGCDLFLRSTMFKKDPWDCVDV
jgi:hypothetical protein